MKAIGTMGNGEAEPPGVGDWAKTPRLLERKSVLMGLATSMGILFTNAAQSPSAVAGTIKPSPIAAALPAYTPRWTPNTVYSLGQQVISPNNDVTSAKVAHTSSAAYVTDTAKWALSPTYLTATEVDVAKYASPQAAIDAAQALSVPVVVKFGRGRLILATPLNVTASDVTLDLGKAILVPAHPGVALTFTGTSGGHLSRVGVIGGKIDLNNLADTGVGFNYCDAPLAERITVVNGQAMNGAGVGFANCPDALIRGIRTENVGCGVTLTLSPRASISNCQLMASKRDGITIYNLSHDATVTGCTVNGYNTSADYGRAGIQIYGSGGCSVSGNSVDSGLIGGTVDSAKIRFRDGKYFTCIGNVVTGLSGSGIVVIAQSDIGTGAGQGTITGNTVRNVSGYGIEVSLGSTGLTGSLHPVAISGNTVIGVRQVDANAGVGILIAAAAGAAVIGNNYLDDLDGEGIVSDSRATIVGNFVHNPGRGTLGSRAGIFVISGAAAVVGNYCIDEQTIKTMVAGLHICMGAIVHASGNIYEGWLWDAVNNEGTQTAQVGEIGSALVGFYGKAPVTQPNAPPVDATDLSTAIALVNDLKTKLRAVGLLA